MTTMETPPRHVSRWRLATHNSSSNDKMGKDGGGASGDDATAVQAAHTSLRYLNEFVGGLQCAPALLQHGLFPDAKEVTESMGLFNAVRRYLLPDKDASAPVNSRREPIGGEDTAKPDGIVVVGDGNTPRSAAMFAFRLRHWKCFSIDPAMEIQSSERSRGWSSIANLVVIRNKIENVRISLRRAIVVLVHAHVTLEQALGAVDADQVVGVVTMPCCNWYSRQEQLFGRHPNLVYDDFSILSDHREIRLWVGESQSEALTAQHSDFASSTASTTGLMKGCIRKEFCPDAFIEIEAIKPSTSESDRKARRSKRQGDSNAVVFLGKLLSEGNGNDVHERETQPREQGVNEAALNAVTTHVPKDASVLVLDSQSDLSWARSMLQQGYTNLFVLKKRPESVSEREDMSGDAATMLLELHRFRSANSTSETEACGTIKVKALPTPTTDSDLSTASINVSVDFSLAQESTTSSKGFSKLTHIVDAGFFYRGFRSQSKNATLFRNVCQLLEQIAHACDIGEEESVKQYESTALVSVTGAKTWRKKEYLSHPALGFDVSKTVLNAASAHSKPVVVFYCLKRRVKPVEDLHSGVPDSNTMQSTRDRVLGMKRALANDFGAVKRSIDADPMTAKDAILKLGEEVVSDASTTTARRYFAVTGKIARIRRFSHGMAFVSLVDDGEEIHGKLAHDAGLDVFIQEETLKESSSSIPFDELVPLFRRGDRITAIGFSRTNDRGHDMLAALAVKFEAGGEFEEF